MAKRRECLANGIDWTEDIEPFNFVRFDFFCDRDGRVNDAGLASDYERLARDYGLNIKRRSHRTNPSSNRQ